MACTFFRAMGLETGKSLVEPDRARHGDGPARPGGREAGAARRCTRGGVARRRRRRRAVVARARYPPTRRCSTSDPTSAEAFTPSDRGREDGGLERADGRVREAAVRRRHARGRGGDGEARRRAARPRSSAAATRPRRCEASASRRGWPCLDRRRRVARIPGREARFPALNARCDRVAMPTCSAARSSPPTGRCNHGRQDARAYLLNIPRADAAAQPTARSSSSRPRCRWRWPVRAARAAGYLVGVQNVHWEEKGAFTGENSVPMARDAGAASRSSAIPSGASSSAKPSEMTAKKCALAALSRRTHRHAVRWRDARGARAGDHAGRRAATARAPASPNSSHHRSRRSRSRTSRCGRSAPARPPRPEDATSVHSAIRRVLEGSASAPRRRHGPDSAMAVASNAENAASLLAAPEWTACSWAAPSLEAEQLGEAICRDSTASP